MSADKWICQECGFIGPIDAFDKVPDPRGPDTWTVCPKCRQPENVVAACDEPGCKQASTCGFPIPDGYRRTCGDHYRTSRLAEPT